MLFPVEEAYKTAILRQFERNMFRYVPLWEEVEEFLRGKEAEFCLCMKYLYGHMAAQDVLSIPVTVFADYVRATLAALEQIEYMAQIPAEIFFPYVLYHRVNSECLDDSRGYLLAELLPYVRGKSMEQAALAVNYWCYAHATYTPADDRTLGPLGVLRRTLGRCGEESVLAVAALRSVGIPARQCYCPRWSHCDDNHAWVEVWIRGSWHYLGACEPEPVLDRGWFTAAASRAMLVDSKCWAGEDLYEIVNCTARYSRTRKLTAYVTENGRPVTGARVCFQIVNYSELYTLWETVTDGFGAASFETGPGDLLVTAQHGQKVALQKVDLRQADAVTLELQPDFPAYLAIDLVPPEDSSGTVPCEENPDHTHRLALCEGTLASRRASFGGDEDFLHRAALNAPEVAAFLADRRFPKAHKEELLNTLRPKDFADITHGTLVDALETANAVRGQYPEDVFREYILAPRIADEMLLPERKAIRSLFPRGFADPGEILAWMQSHMQLLPDEGVSNYYPSALGCLRWHQVPEFAFDMVFVALCRALGFPAGLESHTGVAQWLDKRGNWHSIRPGSPPVNLTVKIPAGKKLGYSEHFSLGAWNGKDFVTLRYPGLTLEGNHTFRLQPGRYRIIVTTRQIDGTASAALWHLQVSSDMTLEITPPADQTCQRLKHIPLAMPDGPLRNLLDSSVKRNLLLIFAEPGSEPTEHLLREMAECAEEFRKLACRILVLAETPDATDHPTIRLLKETLPEVETLPLTDPAGLAQLYLQMQVGDLRKPFMICVDREGSGVYADANYRIHQARTLLEIQKLLEK